MKKDKSSCKPKTGTLTIEGQKKAGMPLRIAIASNKMPAIGGKSKNTKKDK